DASLLPFRQVGGEPVRAPGLLELWLSALREVQLPPVMRGGGVVGDARRQPFLTRPLLKMIGDLGDPGVRHRQEGLNAGRPPLAPVVDMPTMQPPEPDADVDRADGFLSLQRLLSRRDNPASESLLRHIPSVASPPRGLPLDNLRGWLPSCAFSLAHWPHLPCGTQSLSCFAPMGGR